MSTQPEPYRTPVRVDAIDGFSPGLTARQYEVLALAVDEGYWHEPSEVTQVELGQLLEPPIVQATVTKHIRAIERKLAEAYLEAARARAACPLCGESIEGRAGNRLLVDHITTDCSGRVALR